jgi:hypothetical protein
MARLDMSSAHLAATAAALQVCLLLAAPGPLYAQVPPDSLALVELYNAAGGPNWLRDDNWVEGPVSTWYGVTTAENRVTRLELGENGLKGSIPAAIGILTALEVLDLHGNQLGGSIPPELGTLFALRQMLLNGNALTGEVPVELTRLGELIRLWIFDNAIEGLPGLSNMASLFDLQVQDNRLTFEDVEPNVGVAEVFTYAPQADIGEAYTSSIAAGGSFILSYSVGGATNVYQWIHDGVPIFGATDSNYSVTHASGDEEGVYRLQITNKLATQLTLVSEPVTISIEAPDLIVSSLTHAPAEPTSDDVITFTAVVENRGGAMAEASTLELALAGSDTPALIDVPELAPGEDYVAVHEAELTAGEHVYTAAADAHGDVAESDETNNVAEEGLLVVPPPDPLRIILAVTPESVAPLDWGEATTFTVAAVDEQGERLVDSRVTVEDGLQDRIVDAGLTDAEGTLSYDAIVPEGAPEGLFDLVFRAAKQGYASSEPVSRQIRVERREPGLSISSEALDFGEAFVGGFSEQSLMVSNTGRADLSVTPEIAGASAGVFTILSGGEPFALSPSAPPREIVLRYAPLDAAPHEAVLLLRTNAGDRQILLHGVGRAPCISSPDDNERDEPSSDVQHRVRIVVCEGFEPTRSDLFFRKGGETDYQSMELTGSGQDFTGSIPGEFVTERGIDYFIRISAGEFTTTFPPNASAEDPAHVPVRVSLPILRPTRARAYRMVSVPLELTDGGIDGVFGDDYGVSDRSRWRVLRWHPTNERYEEHPGIDETVRPGAAFWLITRDGEPFDVEEAVSVDAAEPYTLILEPGWNQIGNPFAFTVAWSDVIGREGIEGPWFYNADLEDFDACCAPVLQPWEGYFVFNGTENLAALQLPPIESPPTPQEPLPSMAAGAAYSLQLIAERAGGGSRDAHNVVGLATEASGAADRMNLREAPGIDHDIRLSILERGERMAASFKPLAGAGQQWDVEIAAAAGIDVPQATTSVRITLLERGARPDGFEISVLDLDRARAMEVDQHGFEVAIDVGSSRRNLRVIVGTEAFTGEHADGVPLAPPGFELEQNYPNPFNPETIVRYRLPERLHTVLEVYDALGRRVRTLVDAVEEPGLHDVRWDGLDDGGREAASGVYVGRLRAGSHSASIRMSLVR